MSTTKPTVPRTTRDPFTVLGVPCGATAEELRAAYLHRVRTLHPDRHVQSDGTVPAEVHEAFCVLRAAYDQAVRTKEGPTHPAPVATSSQRGRPAAGAVPAQRRPSTTTPSTTTPSTPGAAAQQQRARGSIREADPLLSLLTTPQRSREQWSTEALEAWALTLVPAARRHLADARRHAVTSGAADLRRLTAATAHAMLTLTLSAGFTGPTHRRLADLDAYLASAYDALERDLPPSLLDRLPARCEQATRASRRWRATLAR